jgi:MFS family permease
LFGVHLRRGKGALSATEQQAAAAAPTAGRAALVPLAAAQFLASYDTSSMNVAISSIVEDLNTSVTGVQTAISLFTLTMAALMIPGSKLTDIWGRRQCFVLGMGVYGAGALITAIAPVLGVMIIGFSLLEGIGSALMIPPIYILITVMVHDNTSRAKAFAVVSAMGGLGAALGPLLGGFITTTISWRASFAGEVVAVLAIIYLSRHIPNPPLEGPRPRFDFLGATLSAAGLVFIVLGVLQAGVYGWVTARKDVVVGGNVLLEEGGISPVLVLIAIGLALLAAFFFHIRRSERAGKTPLLQSRLFRSRVTVLGLVTQNSQWFIMIGTFFVVSVFMQVSKGLSAIETGLALTPATAGILVASALIGRLVRKRSQRTIIRLGFVVALAGIAYVLLFVDSTSRVLLFAPGLFLIGLGAGSMLTASVNVVQSSVSADAQGDVSGVSRSVSNLGSSLGTSVAGAVLVAALISGVSSGTQDSDVLPPAEKQEIAAALEEDVSAVSDQQIQAQLAGRPQDIVDEVTRINAEARNRALGLALLSVALIGTIGLIAAIGLPSETAAAPQDRPAPI